MNKTEFFTFNTEKHINFIFSGAPGGGKTTTANYLKEHGNCLLIHEAATVIIKEYQNEGRNHLKDIPNFQRRVEELCSKDLERHHEGICILDRCNFDNVVYKKHYNPGIFVDPLTTAQVVSTLMDHSVSNHVFLFDLSENEEEYERDSTRTESYRDAKVLQDKFSKEYEEAGFHVHHIPWMPLHDRAVRVFEEMANALQTVPERRPLKDLYKIAAGMNDEGGRIQEFLHSGQIWGNLSVTLDRPFVDGKDFDHLRKEKLRMGYAIKEEAIDDLNEHQVNLAYGLIMLHYITQGHRIRGKNLKETLNIVLHSFHGSDGPGHLKVVKNVLDICCPELTKNQVEKDSSFSGEEFCTFFPDQNVHVSFCKGKVDKNPKNSVYEVFKNSNFLDQADIVLTFSTHVGLNLEWQAGTFCIPTEWTPFNVETMEVKKQESYKGNNHLALCINEIIGGDRHKEIAVRLNDLFHSKNPAKEGHKASPLKAEDFQITQFLELGGYIFIPSKEKLSTYTVI